ncbi:MAG: exonuclease [Clostridiaceae bacterium]|jgi:inhibitor of KinA sporulation pathway (predicted exonuclease)|nr:exonuclease [Clostridiaceae bacterium]
MNYIVFDLEFNQGSNRCNRISNINPRCPFEIIQIGAIKLNSEFKFISSFDSLIKPQIYTDINPYVKEITNITIEQLLDKKSFKEVYNELIDFIGHDRNILCVWGTADIKELHRNIAYHGLDATVISREYINIQLHTSKLFNCKNGINIGLKNAVELLNIPADTNFHNAINDAYYTAEVFKKIYNDNIQPKIYNPLKYLEPTKRLRNAQYKQIDTESLIKQFQKMFNREMTHEEQSIIKLAYLMGKTNQFQLNNNTK